MGLLPTTLLRNPRYAILLAVVLITVLVLLAYPHVDVDLSSVSVHVPEGATQYFKSTKHPEATWVKDALKEEEIRYKSMLKDRAAMVRKYGPTPDRVQS